jgi:hypothetical protein
MPAVALAVGRVVAEPLHGHLDEAHLRRSRKGLHRKRNLIK